ncbi:hypothetical protein Tsubulata_027173, partial [Turnera subulata]
MKWKKEQKAKVGEEKVTAREEKAKTDGRKEVEAKLEKDLESATDEEETLIEYMKSEEQPIDEGAAMVEAAEDGD